jgi:hypothetical protein
MIKRTARRPALAAIASMLVCAAALAGCGGSSDSGSAASNGVLALKEQYVQRGRPCLAAGGADPTQPDSSPFVTMRP